MRDNGDGAPFSRKQNSCSIEHRAGGTHPRTEQRPVCGRLVLSVVSRVLGCLSLGQTADGENTEHHRD